MKRREFLFNSLKGALLFTPLFSLRQAEAQMAAKMKALFFVCGGSYPYEDDFFPSQTGTNFQLPPIIADFEELKNDLVIIKGIDIRNSGPAPRGNNHVRAMGKVLTAKDVFRVDGTQDGLPGGPSVDQVIASSLGHKSLEMQIHTKLYNHMRGKPFASKAKTFKTPIVNAAESWDYVFKGFQPDLPGEQAKEERLNRLRMEKSLLDDQLVDLARLRRELTGAEKLKLDINEESIRSAERSVAADMKAIEEENTVGGACTLPDRISSNNIPTRAKAHFDVLFAALACQRIGVAGMMFGYSSIQWRYEWLGLGLNDDIHDAVYHRRSSQRDKHIKASRWNWNHLAELAKKLKATPDGSGNMLDNTLIYATSHFGRHHTLNNIPVMFIGNAQGKLKTGRSLHLSGENTNAKSLTSAAQLCGVNLKGFGDESNSGGIAGL